MENIYSQPEMKLTPKMINHLDNIRKWTLFLSIVGFIFVFFIIVFGFSFGFIISLFSENRPFQTVSSFFVGMMYLVIGIIYFFPVFYLYRFSTYIKKGLRTYDTNEMENAFSSLQTHYTIIGVLTALMLGINILIGVIVAIIAIVSY